MPMNHNTYPHISNNDTTEMRDGDQLNFNVSTLPREIPEAPKKSPEILPHHYSERYGQIIEHLRNEMQGIKPQNWNSFEEANRG